MQPTDFNSLTPVKRQQVVDFYSNLLFALPEKVWSWLEIENPVCVHSLFNPLLQCRDTRNLCTFLINNTAVNFYEKQQSSTTGN